MVRKEGADSSLCDRTGYILDEILRPYVESVEDAKVSKAKVKPLILLCLTDGRADVSRNAGCLGRT